MPEHGGFSRVAMHADTAAKLRQYWADRGNPPCRHPKLELESVSNRYLTGNHVCTTCGAVLTVKREGNVSGDDRPASLDGETNQEAP